MATTTTTAIELESFDNDPPTNHLPLQTTTPQDTRTQDHNNASIDDIASASHLVDAGVPDGGYGWIITLCTGILAFWAIGTSYSWGVIQAGLISEKGLSPSILPWVGSLSISMVAISAIVNARILRALGSQKTSVLGVVLLAVGEVASGFSTGNLAGLFVGTGLVMGMGVAVCFMVTSSIPAQYFWRRRGLATGLAYAAVRIIPFVVCCCSD